MTEPDEALGRARPARARRWIALVAITAVLATAAAWAFHLYRAPRADEPATPTTATLPTKPVTRGDLAASIQVPGQLGYAGSYSLVGQRTGTVTAVPSAGEVLQRGELAYAVDLVPIPLLFGTVPLFRDLAVDAVGPDVRVLEENLVALGHATEPDLTVDDTYTRITEQAVKRWQDALDLPETGTVGAGAAVVAPGEVRVTQVEPLPGQQIRAGETVIVGTGTARSVRVDLELSARSFIRPEQTIRIQLPNGRQVDGTITSIGTATARAADPAGGTAAEVGGQPSACQGDDCPQTVAVEIGVAPEVDLGGIEAGPVSVTFTAETRQNVLSVPVEALSAEPGGEFAVTVVNGEQRRRVRVQTGLFTAGRVEVSGEGIAEGMQVEVPTL